MCYTVLVIETRCHRGHPTKVTSCWRQCYQRALQNFQAVTWNQLCADSEDPSNIDEMVQVSYPELGDPPDLENFCRACADLEADIQARNLAGELEQVKASVTNVNQSLDELDDEIDTAHEKVPGDNLQAYLMYLAQTQRQNSEVLEGLDARLTDCGNRYNEISEIYGSLAADMLFEEARLNLNSRPKIYMGKAKELEKQQREDWPKHHRLCDSEIYPFDIYLC